MWGYEYSEKRRARRRRAILAFIFMLVSLWFLRGVIIEHFGLDVPNVDRQLLEAVSAEQVAQVHVALTSGADPDLRYRDGRTVLHEAAWVGNVQILRALLRAGADPNARTPRVEETPLHTAVRANQPDSILVLLAHGAQSNLRTLDVSEPDIEGNRHEAAKTPREMAEAAQFEQVLRVFRGQ